MRAACCEATVLRNEVIAPDIRLLTVVWPDRDHAPHAGQFFTLRAWGADEAPFLSRPISVHRWNPDSSTIEFLYQVVGEGTEKLADGRHVYDLVGDKLNALGKDYMGEHGYSSIGLVIGGTHIEEATEIRAKYQDSFFLIPGYGAQGGKAEDIAQYLTKGNGGVVNSSRGILLAYKKQPGTAFDEAAYNECVNMKEAIAHACSLL